MQSTRVTNGREEGSVHPLRSSPEGGSSGRREDALRE